MSTKITWERLLAKPANMLCVVPGEESQFDDLVRTAPRQTAVRTIRGKRCTSKESTLQEWAAALQFPSYFGSNWDAFEDCIRDLDWLNTRRVVAVVTSAENVLARSPRDFTTLIDILRLAQKETPLLVVFQCAPEHAAAFRARIDKIT